MRLKVAAMSQEGTAFCLQKALLPTIPGFHEDHVPSPQTTHSKAGSLLLSIKNLYLFISLGSGAHVPWFDCGNQRKLSGTGVSCHHVGPKDRIQVFRLGRHHYPLSPLTAPAPSSSKGAQGRQQPPPTLGRTIRQHLSK